MQSIKNWIFGVLLCTTAFLALTVVGLPAVVFAILPTQQSVTADVAIAVRDDRGQPVAETLVELWEYDHFWRRATTDANGVAHFRGERFDHHVSILNAWSTRPAEFPIRVRVPALTDLYYRYDIQHSGDQQYHIFDDSYDYFFGGHWLGSFDAQRQVTSQISDASGPHHAKDLTKLTSPLQLWHAEASLERVPGPPPLWQLRLDMQLSRQL